MSENWYKISIPFRDQEHKETLIAWLNFLEIEAIVEEDTFIEAFTSNNNTEEIISQLAENGLVQLDDIETSSVANQNWNAVWEASFEAIVVEDVCIRASFHAPDQSCRQEIIIRPQMAFGTGHHETTYMMIEYMRTLPLQGKTVLDYGCGTGILAIYAVMQGATKVTGLDIQPEAIENSLEHIDLNKLSQDNFDFREGDIHLVKADSFDIILANINRHVLLDTAEDLAELLDEKGLLVCSGILKSDESLLIGHYKKKGLQLIHKNYKGDWCLFVFNKSA